MTYEEAIKHLQNLKFKFMDEYVDYDNTAEAFQHGIEALEKQIPQKHHHTRIVKLAINLRESVCPSCLGIIATKNEEYPKYCTRCGQALDWSDEDE